MIFKVFLIIFTSFYCNAITDRDFYSTSVPGSSVFDRGNDKSRLVSLQEPIHFYTEKYDSIYVSVIIMYQ